jgi:hypothetical protein
MRPPSGDKETALAALGLETRRLGDILTVAIGLS